MDRSLALLFVLLSIFVRVIPHWPNVAPIVGIGLFCGATLSLRWALIIPVVSMMTGDFILGWVPENLFGWVAIALSACVGLWLKKKRSPSRILLASIVGSTLFFLISNFGVWVLGCGPGWYPATLRGLMSCYLAGVPFYRNSLAGDLLYTVLFFGSFEFLTRRIFQRSPVHLTASE